LPRQAADVPLSPRAVNILRQLEKVKVSEFVFAGQARNKALSNMAMEMVLRRMKIQTPPFMASALASVIGRAMSPASPVKSPKRR
jgi:hypothetical protein